MTSLADLVHAIRLVEQVLAAGDGNHQPDEWRTHSVEWHIKRAEKHLMNLGLPAPCEDHLVHAATRLLMAIELRSKS